MSSKSKASGWEHSRALFLGVCRSHLGEGFSILTHFLSKAQEATLH